MLPLFSASWHFPVKLCSALLHSSTEVPEAIKAVWGRVKGDDARWKSLKLIGDSGRLCESIFKGIEEAAGAAGGRETG